MLTKGESGARFYPQLEPKIHHTGKCGSSQVAVEMCVSAFIPLHSLLLIQTRT